MSVDSIKSVEEFLYARKLSDINDSVRLKTLKKLHKFLKMKSSGKGFLYEDLIRIWKGLYYCMYMSDKPLVQEDLAENISHLIHELQSTSQKLLYFKVALDTFVREWNGIDKFRMDKFLMLLTRVFRQCLVFLLHTSWNPEEVNEVSQILEESVLTPFDQVNQYPLGIKLHFVDIILEELSKVGKEDLPSHVILTFLVPFLKAFAVSTQTTYLNAIRTRVLENLIKITTEGAKRQEDMTLNEVELVQSKKENGNVSDEEEEEFVMDPRAGGVDVHIPLLKPDYKQLSDALLNVGSIPEVSAKRRKGIYHVARMFMSMEQRKYPLNLRPIKPKESIRKKTVQEAIERYEAREEGRPISRSQIPGKQKKRVFTIRKKHNKYRKKKARKINKTKVMQQFEDQKNTSNTLFNKLTNLSVKSLDSNDFATLKLPATSPNDGFQVKPIGNLNKKANFQKDDNWEVKKLIDKSTEANKIIQGKKRKLKTMKNVRKDSTLKGTTANSVSNDSIKNIRKNSALKGTTANSSCNESVIQHNFSSAKRRRNEEPVNQKNKKAKKDQSESIKNPKNQGNNNKKSADGTKKSLSKENPWNKPLAKGEVEIFVPSKKVTKKMKNATKERKLVINKTPKVNTKGKTLKINLRNNKEHDINDYHRVLKSSPGIPFAAKKKPLNSVLKPSTSPNLVRKSCTSRINFIKKKYNLK